MSCTDLAFISRSHEQTVTSHWKFIRPNPPKTLTDRFTHDLSMQYLLQGRAYIQIMQLLEQKDPKGTSPIQSSVIQINVSPDCDILSMLRSFPKLTAAGPSGMRVQHLLDAASVPLPTPISSALRHVINVLAAGKAPQELAIFLSGTSLTALSRKKPKCQSDVCPIAIREVLRKLTSKCLGAASRTIVLIRTL